MAKKSDIGAYIKESDKFGKELALIKERENGDFEWYPYNIFDNFHAFGQLLTGENRYFFSTLEQGCPIIDVGSADGDLAFFWEKKGFDVHILDYSQTNFNDLHGAKKLKSILDSNVTIIDRDIDSQFDMDNQYNVAFALGILYHLKNPIYFLQKMAQYCEYMFLSTRVATFLPDGKTNIKNISVAYLLGPRECNNDPTNYWIFSPEGLKRVLSRSGWRVLDFITLGSVNDSTPQDVHRDERAFVFATRYDNIHNLLKHHDF